MEIQVMKSKIHRATVTDANLDYEGSITIDSKLLNAADILPHEKVQVVNIDNGERLETYVIPAEEGSGEICLNGAAAHKVEIGHLVIIISYAGMEVGKAWEHNPTVVKVNGKNKIVE